MIDESKPQEAPPESAPPETPDVHAMIQALERRLQESEARSAQLHQEVMQQFASRSPTPEHQGDPELSSDLLWKDPDKFVSTLTRKLQEQVNGVRTELTGAYQKEKSWEGFWSDFWSDNKDLDPRQDERLVKVLLDQNLGQWAHLPIAEARKRLGDATRETIKSYIERDRQANKPPQKDMHTESGFMGSAFRMGQEKPDKVTTLSDVLASRREKRERRA
jgi:hypothetical protein